MTHARMLSAARGRRDVGAAPLPLDNLWLLERCEALNPLPERQPERPAEGSLEGRVLSELRSRPRTVPELCAHLGSKDRSVRGAIDRLRSGLAWPIVNVEGRFLLLIKPKRSA
jgi:hypothetical protein